MKILSLAIGLALGLVLIAKAAFEQNYDGFYEDSGRIHLILEAFPSQTESSLPEIYPTTPGGVLKSRHPQDSHLWEKAPHSH